MISLSIIFKNKANLNTAIYSYQKAIELNSLYSDSFFNLDLAKLLLGDITSTRANLRNALNFLSQEWRTVAIEFLRVKLTGIIKLDEI